MTSKPDFKVMVLLLVFMQLTRDLFAIAKFLLSYATDRQTDEADDPTVTAAIVCCKLIAYPVFFITHVVVL